MKPARVEISAPGASPSQVVRAPWAIAPETKFQGEGQEKLMRSELLSLEESTKLRNLAFYRDLDGIEAHGKKWQVKLNAEVLEAHAQHQQLVKLFDDTIASNFFAEKKRLMNDIEMFHNERMPPEEQRMGQTEVGVETFVSDTIPNVVDRQSGIVSRKLKKAHDTFDIEIAKVMKREQKIVMRFQKHAERTAQAFEDERATRLSKFMLLGEEVADTEREYDRAEEKAVRQVINEIVSIRDLLKDELGVREKEDSALLDSMLYAQERLQEAILRSFGDEAATEAAKSAALLTTGAEEGR